MRNPGVDRGLGLLHGRERALGVEEVRAERAVEPLHFPVLVRGCRGGQPVGDAVAAADLVKQHFPAAGAVTAEPVGELLAIVSVDLLRHPASHQCLGQRQAHRPARRPLYHFGDDAVAGVVVDRGDHLCLPQFPGHRADQLDPADDVHLMESERSRREAMTPDVHLISEISWQTGGLTP